MTKHNKLLAMITLVLLTVIGCTNRQPSAMDADDFNNADGFNRADSIVSAVGETRDNQRSLEVIDSLDKAGELSLVKTIFYRTINYNLLGQYHTSLRIYSQLAGIDVKTLTTRADLESYIYSYNNYVRLLCEMRRYDLALREVNNIDSKLKTIGYDTFTDHHDIAQIIGECQLYLGQFRLAAESFQKSLQGVHTRLTTNHDPLDYRECQKTMNAIVKVYIQNKLYPEAKPWIELQDSLLVIANEHPQRDSVFIDEMKADICYSKARLAFALGHTEESERAFKDYQSTQTAQQLGNIISSSYYLLLTQRYDEAARNYEQLDAFLKGSGYKATLENFGRYMIPKYRANLLAGRRDSAIRVADIVAHYYDTAMIRQKTIDADLLTTFYDTEGKERQIAEQRAELSQQRMFTIAIVLVILIIFFIIYALLRRRAYRKLDATNRQLVIANERAEESSRMKTQFIQQISHEVRTPLNVLSGFTQVLATPDIEISNEQLQDISKKIVTNSERITHLVDKMLDLSQVNSNTVIECYDTVHPIDVALRAIDVSDILQATHLQMQLQLSPEAKSLNFVTNQKSAVKALTLLLDNAIKFTHPTALTGHKDSKGQQHVTLDVSVTKHHVVFAVEDTGIGVPPEQAEYIFSEFVQLNEYSEGTGIGLPIARSLACHMGGDVIIDTTYTDGARFVMTLPKKTAEESPK